MCNLKIIAVISNIMLVYKKKKNWKITVFMLFYM